MKIGHTTDLTVPVSQTNTPNVQKAGEEAAATAKSTASSAGVSVSVSKLARSLGKPEVSVPSDIDTAKVDQVKAAIQNGTYVVNPEAIADKLLSNAQELLNRTTK